MCKPCFIDIEIDISRGLHAFSIIGLADKAVEEARDRISSAIKNSGFDSPKSKNQKIVLSLAPAELRKEGTQFDLAMALAYLKAIEEVDFDPADKMFIGELSLDGILRPLRGVVPLVMAAKQKGIKEIYIPLQNGEEVSCVSEVVVYAGTSLREIADHLNKKCMIQPLVYRPFPRNTDSSNIIDCADIFGHTTAKRALEIAMAGKHNCVLYGPPGTGKTMLARAFAHTLPALVFEDMVEVTALHGTSLVSQPPFRSPHHSAPYTAMIGGGAIPRPGEITLAHKGVLFMDEFPEFDTYVIESLRQPLEDKKVVLSRTKYQTEFPADFILIGAMNPCPCGYRGSAKTCVCSMQSLQRYYKKISGPIVDRIDMWIEVPQQDYEVMNMHKDVVVESSADVARRIVAAREFALHRNKKVELSPLCKKLLKQSAEKLGLSTRGYMKVVVIARTIADSECKKEIEPTHILEALQYRPKLL